MQILSRLLTVPALLSAMPTDDILSAQVKAGAVGGAILGTLIGIGIGLMWLLLIKRKSRHRRDKEDRYDDEQMELEVAKKAEKEAEKRAVKKVAKQVENRPKPMQQKGSQKVASMKKITPEQEPIVMTKEEFLQEKPQAVQVSPMLVTFVDVDDPQNQIPIVITDQTIVGRNGERCDIVIKDETVSSVHCKIYKTNKNIFLIDLASTNGTYVNGVKANKIMPLNVGDIVQIGLKKYIINY